MPDYASPGSYSLRVEGTTPDGGSLFVNETQLTFEQKHVSVFIQTDKWFYQKRQTSKYLQETSENLVSILVSMQKAKIVSAEVANSVFMIITAQLHMLLLSTFTSQVIALCRCTMP